MKNSAKTSGESNRNLKYMHLLTIWSELTEIVGGDKKIGAILTTAFFCSQLAGSTPNPYSRAAKRARRREAAAMNASISRRGNPRNRSKPNRPKPNGRKPNRPKR